MFQSSRNCSIWLNGFDHISLIAIDDCSIISIDLDQFGRVVFARLIENLARSGAIVARSEIIPLFQIEPQAIHPPDHQIDVFLDQGGLPAEMNIDRSGVSSGHATQNPARRLTRNPDGKPATPAYGYLLLHANRILHRSLRLPAFDNLTVLDELHQPQRGPRRYFRGEFGAISLSCSQSTMPAGLGFETGAG
jgi:hypothetical protein